MRQALYFCEPLRQELARVKEEDANGLSGTGRDNGSSSGGGSNSKTGGSGGSGGGGGSAGGNSDVSVLSQLAELFSSISKQRRRSGHLAPTEFLRTLRERNGLFRGNMQQVICNCSILCGAQCYEVIPLVGATLCGCHHDPN